MSYTTERIASNKVKLSFVFPAEDFDAAIQQAYLKNRGKIRIPGFRPGKAPKKLIENWYGAGVFYEDAFDLIVPDAYSAAIKEADIKVVDRPEVSVDQMEAGQELKVTMEVFVVPEVELGQYKGLTVQVEQRQVEEADIDARIQQDRAKASRVEEILDRPVAEGDTVKLDYAGTVDGVAFEGGTAQNQTLTIGSHTFIPGFEEQMVGMCVAEEKDLHVTFPENYQATELAGKDAVFHVKVNTISHTEMPELDDEFAADVSDYSTFAEYRESIVRELEEKNQKNNRVAAENAALELATQNATIDVPEAMITDETDSMIRSMELNMMYQGIKLDDYLKYLGMTREQLAAQQRPEAERNVRIQLVVDAIRKAENVEATEEEIEKATAEQAERMGQDLEAFKKNLTDAQKENLKNQATAQKVIDLIMQDATIEAVKPEAPEAADAPAADEAEAK